MIGIRRKHKPTPAPAPLVQPVDRAESRDRQLREYDILRAVEERSESQQIRLEQLSESLWPPRGHNPMNGIRRVPGGHGYPIPDRAPVVVADQPDRTPRIHETVVYDRYYIQIRGHGERANVIDKLDGEIVFTGTPSEADDWIRVPAERDFENSLADAHQEP